MKPSKLALMLRKQEEEKEMLRNRQLAKLLPRMVKKENEKLVNTSNDEDNQLLIQTTLEQQQAEGNTEYYKNQLRQNISKLSSDKNMSDKVYEGIIRPLTDDDIQKLVTNWGLFLKKVKEVKGSGKLSPDIFVNSALTFVANFLTLGIPKRDVPRLENTPQTNNSENIENTPSTNNTENIENTPSTSNTENIETNNVDDVIDVKSDRIAKEKRDLVYKLTKAQDAVIKLTTNITPYNNYPSMIEKTLDVANDIEESIKTLDRSDEKNKQEIYNTHKGKNEKEVIKIYTDKVDIIFDKFKKSIKKRRDDLISDFNKNNWFENITTSEENGVLGAIKSAQTRDTTTTEETIIKWEFLFSELMTRATTPKKKIKGGRYRKKLIFGRGYEKVKKNLAQINKYYIDLDALNKNVLKLKYVKNRNIVPNCPIQRGISDDVKNMIIDITENNFYKEKYNKLSERDKQIFIDFCNSAHLDVGISLDKTNEDEKQLNILYGAYMAGNKDEKIITQIKKLLSKAMKLNKISSKQAISILEDLE